MSTKVVLEMIIRARNIKKMENDEENSEGIGDTRDGIWGIEGGHI